MPITRLSISRSLCTSGVKSESPVPIANVVMNPRSYASSMASTAILMSAAFLREPPSPLRDLDQLDLRAGEQAAVVGEEGPVRVGAPGQHASAFGQRVCDQPELERRHTQPVAGPDGQVLVVEEQRDAFVVVDQSDLPWGT